ncbi:MAG: histidine phosphatase family protein [Capnocytophaga sp.]|nr:histidine phosphatase family protein [Capnocytophaga sp.]
MKQLHLVRHAKSSWDLPLDDRKRPLATRGINDAHLVCKALEPDWQVPEAIFVSPSVRTRETSAIFVNELKMQAVPFFIENDLYDFSGEYLIRTLEDVDDCYQNIMIFGHNEAVTYFTNRFSSTYVDNVPTCGYLFFQFDIDCWKDLRKGVLLRKIFPKELR